MLGKLEDYQIEELLNQQAVGRIGCHADNTTYIVPINYAYRDNNIYAHSAEGKKIEYMRKNPRVCFQVDQIKSITNWKSVIAWGEFHEITDRKEMVSIMQEIIQHIMPQVSEEQAHPSHGFAENESDIGTNLEIILYKISLTKKTGRFEQP